MVAYAKRPGKKVRVVRNLGWLLREFRNQLVTRMVFVRKAVGRSWECRDGYLCIRFEDGSKYVTDFASESVCRDLLMRQHPTAQYKKSTGQGVWSIYGRPPLITHGWKRVPGITIHLNPNKIQFQFFHQVVRRARWNRYQAL